MSDATNHSMGSQGSCALAVSKLQIYSHPMKAVIDLEDLPGKVVGRRHLPSDGLALQNSRSIEDARAWKRAFRMLPIPRGIYRFRTHEEADEWLWQMLTRRR